MFDDTLASIAYACLCSLTGMTYEQSAAKSSDGIGKPNLLMGITGYEIQCEKEVFVVIHKIRLALNGSFGRPKRVLSGT